MLEAALRRIDAASVFQNVAQLLPVVHECVKSVDVDYAQFRQHRHDILVKAEAVEHRKEPSVKLGNVVHHRAHVRNIESRHDERIRENLEDKPVDENGGRSSESRRVGRGLVQPLFEQDASPLFACSSLCAPLCGGISPLLVSFSTTIILRCRWNRCAVETPLLSFNDGVLCFATSAELSSHATLSTEKTKT